jgi:flagellar biosynthetic protein FliQ
MNEADAVEIIRLALWTVVLASGPPVVAAMIVGTVIALLQALTQVQEMTLTFVPKMIAVFVVIVLSGSFIGGQLLVFSEQSYSMVEAGFRDTGQLRGERSPGGASNSLLRPGFSSPAPFPER